MNHFLNFKENVFEIIGGARTMFANQISYWLDVTGPSYTIDTACSSSLIALEHAYRGIREELCDAAIVGGGNLCRNPYVTLQFSRLGNFKSSLFRITTSSLIFFIFYYISLHFIICSFYLVLSYIQQLYVYFF